MFTSKNAIKYIDDRMREGLTFEEMMISPVSSIIGGFAGSIGTEATNTGIINNMKKEDKK